MNLLQDDLCDARQAMGLIATIGAVLIRDHSNMPEYVAAEADHIHNLPDYMLDPDLARHLYYWNHERALYLERVQALQVEHCPSPVTVEAWKALWSVYERYNEDLPPEQHFRAYT
ncbi:hypothetical protein LCGC14_1798890 [marine sediment metagenome]|uniref:Uncharacterized protein n=1 Tax=marine sediment metagenome TaxID=412755 RepID=A0A0F9J4Z2_9ZZZZ